MISKSATAKAPSNPRLDPLTLPLQGSRLIEASAGTGKTFTIALLYVRAILGHGDVPSGGRLLTPRDILVVTFTEAATKELRDRIRQRLAEAAAVFREPPGAETASASDPLRQLRDQYHDPAQWPAKARLLELAAESMDEAAVHTIHGWCNRMLREHAFDSGGLFNQSLETDQSELLAQVVRDYWRTFVTPLDQDSAGLWLKSLATPEALQQEVAGLLGLGDQLPLGDEDPGRLLGDMVTRRRQVFDRARQDLAQQADDFAVVLADAKGKKAFNGNMLRMNHVASWLERLREWGSGKDLNAPDLSDSAWHRLTPEGIEEAWKSGAAPTEHPLVVKVSQLKAACSTGVPRTELLFHATRWMADRLEREKQRRAEMGFDDLLHRLDRALGGDGGERLATAIRSQFPLALIDEFQDTDPVQYRIFDTVFRVRDDDPNTGLLMIGDPKQAIYAFRGADIFTYLKAREATAGRHVTLPRNFRSAAAMVSASNRVFAFAETEAKRGAFLFRRARGNPVPFDEVEAHGRAEYLEIQQQAPPALTFWVREGEDAKAQVIVETAEACASHIVHLLNLGQTGAAGFRHPDGRLQALRSSDFAILVNNGTEARHVRAALDRRSVKSVYLSDRASVLDTAQARDMLHWLEACAEPERDRLVRAALATATLDVDWQTLDQLRSNELAWEAEIESFRQLHRSWQRQGVLAMIRRLLQRFDVPARLLGRADGERILTDVLHLAELLQQESRQVDGEQSLIRRFRDMVTAAHKQSESLQVRLESDADLVQVVTVHKSKGLEYPLVFLPFATHCRPVRNQDLPLRWHDEAGNQQVAFEASDDVLQQADEERLGEDIRKLYVALTRARHATWVGAPALKGEEDRSALSYLVARNTEGSFRSRLEQLAAGCDHLAVAALPPVCEESYQPPAERELTPARVPTRRAREDWWISSYSAIRYRAAIHDQAVNVATAADARQPSWPEAETPGAERFQEERERPGAALPPPVAVPAPEVADIHGFYRGAGPGTFLHDLLEWCAEQGFASVLANPQTLRERLHQQCLSRGWQAWAEPLWKWLQAYLQVPLALPGAAPMRLGDLSQVMPELEFWFASNGVQAEDLDQLVRRHTLHGQPADILAARPPATTLALNGMLKGFIDLVFEHDGRYYVADYKSNTLGTDDQAYTPNAMARVVAEKRYDLQYAIYLLALHRLLASRLPGYDYDRHIGGAAYLFLRGSGGAVNGLHFDRPDRQLIEAMDTLFRQGRIPHDGVMEQELLL
ncbi:exodeoxyribonuclease V subunit beta [Marinobacter sp. SS21]|uniref:exodeoxyribonuclease V subunit beta n=1 Tax=Marinobacter sp. SS21 TaxID=2979460 RepID=UPI00232DDB18|nr:exodeoxyribonuclease V subunit beta [Marinobacter sp. SS21]MDC0663374.1 exodeoxyribonuclease V subunit beta [Marinobacter sp. SS21]